MKQVLRGYPYAAVLAFRLLFMAVIAPLRKVRSIAKRWADAHIGVVIKPGGYERVAADLEHALDQAGLGISRRRAPRVLEAPAKLLGAVAGPGVERLVPDHLLALEQLPDRPPPDATFIAAAALDAGRADLPTRSPDETHPLRRSSEHSEHDPGP
ncbi:MAG: hypothetical protein H0X16_02105 [Chloroflexi bacterium]|nr:hypothetical protein [Chloroflexota bacterium]